MGTGRRDRARRGPLEQTVDARGWLLRKDSNRETASLGDRGGAGRVRGCGRGPAGRARTLAALRQATRTHSVVIRTEHSGTSLSVAEPFRTEKKGIGGTVTL